MYGDKLKAALSSRHLADARLSASYQLAPKLRVFASSATPRANLTRPNVTVMVQYTDSKDNGAFQDVLP